MVDELAWQLRNTFGFSNHVHTALQAQKHSLFPCLGQAHFDLMGIISSKAGAWREDISRAATHGEHQACWSHDCIDLSQVENEPEQRSWLSRPQLLVLLSH